MIYIQTPNGLTQISSKLTKEKIIAALGYTPADNATFYEDESGKLVISDEKGYIIAKIDEEGLQTTALSAKAIKLNDEDLSVKLQELQSSIENLDIDIDLTPYALKADTDSHMENENIHVTSAEKYSWDAKSTFSGNYSDLSGAPNIVADESDNEFVICDVLGNVIMRVNAYGINTTAVYTSGKLVTLPTYSPEDEGKTLTIINGIPTWA